LGKIPNAAAFSPGFTRVLDVSRPSARGDGAVLCNDVYQTALLFLWRLCFSGHSTRTQAAITFFRCDHRAIAQMNDVRNTSVGS